jgi:hypothetical protein
MGCYEKMADEQFVAPAFHAAFNVYIGRVPEGIMS